jgi:energy-coupling factor transporter ATP-binding protein EcfA2
MARLSIKNTKAIRELDVDFEPGTITVLNGPNGAGKSTTLQVLHSAIAEKNIGDLEPTDGQRAGLVEFDGITIKVGKRVSFSGESSGTYCLIEGGEDVAAFINPGVKDKEAADKRRLEKLCSIVGAELTDDDIRKFIGDDLWDDWKASPNAKKEGIVDVAKSLKRWLEEQARDIEAKIVGCTAELDAIGIIPKKTEVPDVAGLQAESDRIVGLLTEAKAKRKAGLEAAEALESVKDAVKDPDTEELLLVGLEADRDAITEEIQAAEAVLAGLRASLDAKKQEIKTARESIEVARTQASRFEKLQAAVRDSVTQQQIDDLQAQRDAAAKTVQDAIVLRSQLDTAEQNRQRAAALKSQREKLEAQAERCRAKATEAPTLLQKVVKNLEGWSISTDMRLCCKTDRSDQEAYDDLSPGLKAIRALELACMKPGSGGRKKLVECPQEIWESLDGKNRAIVHDWVVKYNLTFVTGECRQKDKCESCGFEQPMGHEVCSACDSPMSPERLTAERYTP